jgi:hypothetical protein
MARIIRHCLDSMLNPIVSTTTADRGHVCTFLEDHTPSRYGANHQALLRFEVEPDRRHNETQIGDTPARFWKTTRHREMARIITTHTFDSTLSTIIGTRIHRSFPGLGETGVTPRRSSSSASPIAETNQNQLASGSPLGFAAANHHIARIMTLPPEGHDIHLLAIAESASKSTSKAPPMSNSCT